jgi:hypothetical protein
MPRCSPSSIREEFALRRASCRSWCHPARRCRSPGLAGLGSRYGELQRQPGVDKEQEVVDERRTVRATIGAGRWPGSELLPDARRLPVLRRVPGV